LTAFYVFGLTYILTTVSIWPLINLSEMSLLAQGPRRCLWFTYVTVLRYVLSRECMEMVQKSLSKQTWKSLNRQNGFRTTLERLSCPRAFTITQGQTKVSFFYLNPLLQVEFRAIFEPFSYIFEPFSYILLNGSKRNAILWCM